MSVENVKSFIAKLASDPIMQSKISMDAKPEDLVVAAKAAGFEFSVEDLVAAQPSSSSVTELSDSDLEQVAGAGNYLWSLFGCGGKDDGGGKSPGGDEPPDTGDSGGGGGGGGPIVVKPGGDEEPFPDLVSVGIYSPESCGVDMTSMALRCK